MSVEEYEDKERRAREEHSLNHAEPQTDFWRFIEEFGTTGLHALLARSLAAPLIFAATFLFARPLIARLREPDGVTSSPPGVGVGS